MRRAEAITKLKTFEPRLRAMGATSLFLFGSTARGDESPGSDIDVFLDVPTGVSFTLFEMAAARRLLSEGLRTSVDLTMRDEISPKLSSSIFQDAVKVF